MSVMLYGVNIVSNFISSTLFNFLISCILRNFAFTACQDEN